MYVHVKYFVSSVPAAANSLENFIVPIVSLHYKKNSSVSYSEIKRHTDTTPLHKRAHHETSTLLSCTFCTTYLAHRAVDCRLR